eukprot:SAG11_NODE_9039_length_950_cov_1.418331_1_plen_292_part_00
MRAQRQEELQFCGENLRQIGEQLHYFDAEMIGERLGIERHFSTEKIECVDGVYGTPLITADGWSLSIEQLRQQVRHKYGQVTTACGGEKVGCHIYKISFRPPTVIQGGRSPKEDYFRCGRNQTPLRFDPCDQFALRQLVYANIELVMDYRSRRSIYRGAKSVADGAWLAFVRKCLELPKARHLFYFDQRGRTFEHYQMRSHDDAFLAETLSAIGLPTTDATHKVEEILETLFTSRYLRWVDSPLYSLNPGEIADVSASLENLVCAVESLGVVDEGICPKKNISFESTPELH